MRLILRSKPPSFWATTWGGAKSVLSPDGRFVLFDVFRPSGGDIWSLEGL
jgi:hypothetical protein